MTQDTRGRAGELLHLGFGKAQQSKTHKSSDQVQKHQSDLKMGVVGPGF